MYNVGMEKKTTTSILEVKNISFPIIMIYRQLWGYLDLEEVQEIYKRDGLDATQIVFHRLYNYQTGETQ